jgi:hypothetical protein
VEPQVPVHDPRLMPDEFALDGCPPVWDVAARPARQKSLSSSTTGRPVTSPKLTARVNLPAVPGPTMATHCTVVYGAFARSLRSAQARVQPGCQRW